jgi:small subunit ribosomal protein S18
MSNEDKNDQAAPKAAPQSPPQAAPDSTSRPAGGQDSRPRSYPPSGDRGGYRGGGDRGGDRGGYRGGGGRGGPGGRSFFRRKVCRFCTQNLVADYKNADLLRRFVTERGKILPRRITGTCAKHQRDLSMQIKRARTLAFLPFTKH